MSDCWLMFRVIAAERACRPCVAINGICVYSVCRRATAASSRMLGAERDRFRCKFFEKLLYAGLCPWPKDANDVEFCMPRGARLAGVARVRPAI